MTTPQISIGLINPKSPDNVGSVLRAAANYGADQVLYTGNRYPRAIERSARSVDMSRKLGRGIPISQADCLIDAVAEDVTIICVEFAENASPLPAYQHPQKALYIFGPEDGSISQEVIDRADDVLYIPTVGSMNLSATVNVLLYDRLVKTADYGVGNAFIRESRDTNNRLKAS